MNRRVTVVITLEVQEDLDNEAILAEIRSHLDSVPGFIRADVQLLRSSGKENKQ
jgi:antibiotic biosynthesis monooxygenase (ABM) superfamily enzyme